jgi:hypothetical protein
MQKHLSGGTGYFITATYLQKQGNANVLSIGTGIYQTGTKHHFNG